jgi:hypothetical protein
MQSYTGRVYRRVGDDDAHKTLSGLESIGLSTWFGLPGQIRPNGNRPTFSRPIWVRPWCSRGTWLPEKRRKSIILNSAEHYKSQMARQGSNGRKVGKVHIVLDIFVCFARLSLSAGQNRVTIGNRFFIRVPKLDGLILSTTWRARTVSDHFPTWKRAWLAHLI